MGEWRGKGASLDTREARLVEDAARTLSRVTARAPASSIFDAIRPCIPPLEGGMLSILRPGSRDPQVSHAVRLPQGLFEVWMSTPPELLQPTIAPLLVSADGSLLRDSETIRGPLRERLEPIRKKDAVGLGEGAGYKVMARAVPWQREEQFMLALIMARGAPVPPRAEALLRALNPAIRAAVLRTGLPLVAQTSILAQVLEEQSIGYLCVGREGRLIEANRRAVDLVLRYRERAGVSGRHRVAEFARRAQERARPGRPWYVEAGPPPALLEVNLHRLAKETHALREDITLVMMNELLAPLPIHPSPALSRLSPRQREIAVLIGRSADSYKQVAARLDLTEATVRKHVENIYRLLRVHSRAELSLLLKSMDPSQG
ncbi:MAG: LuxR C-terminal-related transcriptional regulator [Minicystis sp.]